MRARSWLWFLLFARAPRCVAAAVSPPTLEAFDYPKALLLEAVALLAIAWCMAGLQPARAALAGDPLALGVVAFGLSAAVSSVASLSPRTSWFGAPESFAGLLTVLSYMTLFFVTRAACATMSDARGDEASL